MSKKHFRHQKIIWAIDPFDTDPKINRQVISTLKVLKKDSSASIEPVHAMKLEQSDATAASLGLLWMRTAKKETEKAIAKITKASKIKGMKPPKVLGKVYESTRTAVNEVTKYAEKSKADLIVIATHANEGLPRLFLGSFAETLFLHSKVPVFLVSPNTHHIRSIKNVFFPTTFTKASRRAFQQVIGFAKEHNAEVTLFTHVDAQVEPLLGSVYAVKSMMPDTVDDFINAEKKKRKKKAQDWIEQAEHQGVKVHLKIDAKAIPNHKAIINGARSTKSQVIAMASEKSTLGAILFGSVTRQVVRHSSLPVWVFHPKK